VTATLRPVAAVDRFDPRPFIPAQTDGAAVDAFTLSHRDAAASRWRQAEQIRAEWLAVGLATQPADRQAAQAAVGSLYARTGREQPLFVWVDSPRAALPRLDGFPGHEELFAWLGRRRPPGRPPLASDIAAGLSRLRSALSAQITPAWFDHPPKRPEHGWPVLAPQEALRARIPFAELVHQGVREALWDSLGTGGYRRIRAAVPGDLPVGWYGPQEAYWIAPFDVYRRLGLARFTDADARHLDDWAALAVHGGWWWPGERVCVLVERPALLRVEPVPGAWHGQVRLAAHGEPAITYRDGWSPALN
jgi:hypothetical protein